MESVRRRRPRLCAVKANAQERTNLSLKSSLLRMTSTRTRRSDQIASTGQSCNTSRSGERTPHAHKHQQLSASRPLNSRRRRSSSTQFLAHKHNNNTSTHYTTSCRLQSILVFNSYVQFVYGAHRVYINYNKRENNEKTRFLV